MLARHLDPIIFGAFGIIIFVAQQIPVVLFDLGLPDALIQKKKPLNQKELSTVFTINAVVAVIFVALIYFLAPKLADYYQIDSLGPWLFRIFSLGIFGFLLESIPLTLLKRKISFARISLVSSVGIVSFNLATITFVFLGFGLMGLILGVLVAKAISLFFLFRLQTWKISFNFDLKELNKLFSFGLPLRGTALVGLISLSIVPILIGSVSGLAAVGYFNFADRISNLFLIAPSIIGVILFPSLSRAQNNPALFKQIIEKSIEWMSFLIFPCAAIFIALSLQVVSLFFTDKWLPAITIVNLSVLTVVITSIGGVITQALFSLGEAKLILKITLLTTLLQWIISLALISAYGYNGVAFSRLIVSLTALLPFIILRRKIRLDLFDKVFPYFSTALISAFIVSLLVPHFIKGIPTLTLLFAIGLGVYLLLLAPFKIKYLWHDGLKIKGLLLAKSPMIQK